MSKVKLGDVAELITKGTTPTSIGGGFTEFGINFVKSESIANSKYLNADIFEKIDEGTDKKLKRSRLKKDDLLFSIAGAYLGKVAIVRDSDVPANTNQAVGIVRLKHDIVDKDYAYYFYSLKHITAYINNLSAQSSQPNLNLDLLGRLPFELKALKDQQKIAAVLSALDAKIDCNNRINAELEAMAKTLYDYWFVQFDFPDANGKPYKSSGGKMVYNAALKRETPEGWEIGNVSELCYLNHRIWPNKDHPDQVSYIDLANVNNGEILGVQNFDWYDAPSRARRILSPGDTIIGTVRPGNRSFALVPNSEEILTGSTGFAVLTPKSAIYREFNYLSLTSESNINRLTTVASDAAYPAVNPEVVTAQSMAIPGKYLVKQFHETTSSLFNLLERHRDQNQQLAQLRDWLLPLLMNGQVTVA